MERPRKYRGPTLGGSSAAAAVGVDPHRSAVMLWAELVGLVEREPSEAMRWGTLLEPAIREELEVRGYELMPAPADGFGDPERPWLVGHPDGFTVLNGDTPAVLELKTAGQWAHRSGWDGPTVPVAYQVQAQTYMHLTDRPACLVACLVGGQRLELHELTRDDNAIEMLLPLLDDFVEHVRTNVPPPPDGSASSRAAIIALYPEAEDRKVCRLSRAEWDVVLELRERKEQLATVKEQVSELENHLKLAMGKAELAISPMDTEVLKWTNVWSSRVDVKELRAAHPEIADEFTERKPTRRFTVL